MVHRAPDSRLLANLIHHEKEYARHFAAVFPLSHAAIASLSAYAAAAPASHPASPAHTIAAVVDVLASADDALQRYTHAVDTWREQLVALKALEDDLGAVLRDRDILVTRLIKASKSTRDANRSSRIVATLGSASHLSLPSTNSTTGSSPASNNAKLTQAQAELQACEAHLVSKERELDARRITIARDGLGARCRALIDCGWVWGEMGKQGLRALQALSADEGSTGRAATRQSLAIPPYPSTHAPASDDSSLTPSQSASQTATRSVETSHEGPTSKEHEHTQPKSGAETTSKSQSLSTRANEDRDLTITLPPAHAIPELAFPTGVHAQPVENGDSTAVVNTHTGTQPTPALRRKRTKRPRRPPSQHIAEVDESPDEPSSTSRNANARASSRVTHTPSSTTRAPETRDSSSDDDDATTGPLHVVENDPFEVIRRSMLGPASASPLLTTTTPTARASAPDVRVSIVDEGSPSHHAFPSLRSGQGQGQDVGVGTGSPPGSSPAKRQRRTSMAFFGSLRGLFRKPKERERAGVEWDEGHPSPSPSPNQMGAKTSGGWVTRTDARVKARGREDSDEEATPTQRETGTRTTNVARAASGARLRKGRPGASTRENGPSRVPSHRIGVDGWITDSPTGPGTGAGTKTTGVDNGDGETGTRSRTRRGTTKRKKTSVADLRGSDQGHTDGEVDEGHRSLERVSSKGRGKASEASVSKPIVKVEEERQVAASTDAEPTANPNPGAELNGDINTSQHRRAVTTTATTSRKLSSDPAAAHRRSASLSVVDVHVMAMSTPTPSQAITQSMSWRKPPPQVDTSSQPAPPSQATSSSQAQAQPSSRTHESQPKQNAIRQLGKGHAKHAHNQSLMSIVADVTRLNQGQERSEERERTWVVDRARSLDIPRAPGSVLREAVRDRGQEVGETVKEINGRGHGVSTVGGPVGQGQGQTQRAIKLPLRSALRNASRTPSPSPGPASVIAPVKEVKKEGAEEDRGRVVSPPWRDSASISSYATGRESLDGEERAGPSSSPSPLPPRSPPLRSQSQPPAARSYSPILRARSRTPSPSPPPTLSFTFPPPPVDPPPTRGGVTAPDPNPVSTSTLIGNGNAVEPPSSSVSTETQPARRRKSVRVSLQPTFSPAPPALRDEDDGEYAPGPWSVSSARSRAEERSRRAGRKAGQQGDMWADSSEEDEEYGRARRLLSLVGRGKA